MRPSTDHCSFRDSLRFTRSALGRSLLALALLASSSGGAHARAAEPSRPSVIDLIIQDPATAPARDPNAADSAALGANPNGTAERSAATAAETAARRTAIASPATTSAVSVADSDGDGIPDEIEAFYDGKPPAQQFAELVGATPGAFEVGTGGSAVYRIPITVPPGTRGMQPQLSLVYDSSGGNRLLGIGWALGGTSVITRCASKLEPDGLVDPVDFDDNDRFCLNGQRLVPVSTGANLEYRTEIDSFQRIVAQGATAADPTAFKVWTKDGRILSFGGTADSRIEAPRRTQALVWALNRVEDRAGNYLTYSYTENNAAGSYWLARADYTGNAAAGVTPNSSVVLSYESRSDVVEGYQAGAKVTIPVRLTKIETFAGATRVRTYQLAYQTGTTTGRSRLRSVQECGYKSNGALSCLPATGFSWQEGAPGFNATSEWAQIGGTGQLSYADVDGDGKSDAIYRRSDNQWFVGLSRGTTYGKLSLWLTQPGDLSSGMVAYPDVNGDGRADLVYQTTANQFYVALSIGTAYAPIALRLTHGAGIAESAYPDVDGDGRADVVFRNNDNSFFVSLSTGTGYTPPALWLDHGGDLLNGEAAYPDLNGDGRADVLYRNVNNDFFASLSTGSSFTPPALWLHHGGAFASGEFDLADFNADGLDDVVYRNTSDQFFVSLSTGATFLPPAQWTQQTSYLGFGQAHYADVNGDGRADLLYRSKNNEFSVAYSTGSSFGPPKIWTTQSGAVTIGNEAYADADGDGSVDLMYKTDDNRIVVSRSTTPRPDLLAAIRDGIASENFMIYRPLTDAAVYQKGTGALYPVVDVQSAARVLTQALSSNGLGGYSRRTLVYSGLREQIRRGLDLGFASIQQTDEARGTLTTTQYNQTFPIMETESSVEMRALTGPVRMRINSVVTSAMSSPGPVYRVMMPSHVETFFDLDGSVTVSRTTNRTYDAFNNVLELASLASDGYAKITSNTYRNDTVAWLIGLPVSTGVRGMAPDVPILTHFTMYDFDSRGIQNRETIEPETPLQLDKALTLDVFGNVTRVEITGADIQARSEGTTYDARGLYPVSATNALGHRETRSYDPRFGVPLTQTGPNQLSTTYAYDPLGRQVQRNTPEGRILTQAWAVCTRPEVPCPTTGVISARSQLSGQPPTYAVTDVLGREVRRSTLSLDQRVIHVDTEYDAMGRTKRTSLEYFQGELIPWTTYGYDALDRMMTRLEPDGSTTTWDYNKLTTTTTNALQQRHVEVKNSQDKVLRASDTNGSSNTFVYDAFENQLRATDALNHVATRAYDRLGRLVAQSDPDLGSSTTTYDALGQVIREQDAKGQTRTFTYDLLGRPLVRKDMDGQTTWMYDTAPKGVGKIASVQGTFGKTSFTKSFAYDGFGRDAATTTVIDGHTYTTTQKYDVAGRESGLVYPDGFETRTVYSDNGHPERVENAATGAAYWSVQEQNAAGQYTRELLGNGLTTRRVFDPLTRHLNDIKTGAGSSSQVQNLSYAWDALGNLKRRSDVNRSLDEILGYDSLNRLTSASIPGRTPLTYAYDAIGNITSKSDVGTYTYGTGVRPHAVIRTMGALSGSYGYDANGNQTQRLDANGTVVGTLDYTSFNKPSSITKGTGSALSSSTFRYDDARDLLYRSDFVASTGETTTTYYAGESFEETAHTDGKLERRHFIRGAAGVVAVYTTGTLSAATLRYLHRDHLGSVQTITDESGAVTEELSYDPFGRRRNADWTPAKNAIQSSLQKGFGGHEELDHLELVHMGGRMYDPVLGRFTSPDPFVQMPESTQGFNRYTYVDNNPLSNSDPSGFFLKRLGKFFGRLFKKVGTVFRNPAFLLRVGTCVLSQGSICDWQGMIQDIGHAALYGDEGPSTPQWLRSLPSAGERTYQRCGIASCDTVKIPEIQEEWSEKIDPTSSSGAPAAANAEPESGSGGGAVLAAGALAVTAEAPVLLIAIGVVGTGYLLYDYYTEGPVTQLGRVAIDSLLSGVESLPQTRLETRGGGDTVADAPGLPGEAEGYRPPKNWDGRKVKNPNGPGAGFPDRRGNVWVPTGPGSRAHGGPHWDVQHPDGSHTNVYPGGKVR